MNRINSKKNLKSKLKATFMESRKKKVAELKVKIEAVGKSVYEYILNILCYLILKFKLRKK